MTKSAAAKKRASLARETRSGFASIDALRVDNLERYTLAVSGAPTMRKPTPFREYVSSDTKRSAVSAIHRYGELQRLVSGGMTPGEAELASSRLPLRSFEAIPAHLSATGRAVKGRASVGQGRDAHDAIRTASARVEGHTDRTGRFIRSGRVQGDDVGVDPTFARSKRIAEDRRRAADDRDRIAHHGDGSQPRQPVNYAPKR